MIRYSLKIVLFPLVFGRRFLVLLSIDARSTATLGITTGILVEPIENPNHDHNNR